MAEHLLNDLRMDTLLEKLCRAGVPQCVEGCAGYFGRSCKGAKTVGNFMRRPRIARIIAREDVARA
jgi:hypothetical protein